MKWRHHKQKYGANPKYGDNQNTKRRIEDISDEELIRRTQRNRVEKDYIDSLNNLDTARQNHYKLNPRKKTRAEKFRDFMKNSVVPTMTPVIQEVSKNFAKEYLNKVFKEEKPMTELDELKSKSARLKEKAAIAKYQNEISLYNKQFRDRESKSKT